MPRSTDPQARLRQQLAAFATEPAAQRSEEAGKNTTALAFLAHWYATPDATPPGTWDELEAAINAHPFQVGEAPRRAREA